MDDLIGAHVRYDVDDLPRGISLRSILFVDSSLRGTRAVLERSRRVGVQVHPQHLSLRVYEYVARAFYAY